MASTLQLEFAQAMSDFKTMFPDMERDVIEAVLRANQGAVDATIDQLLAMSTDNQNEKLRNELEQSASISPPQRMPQSANNQLNVVEEDLLVPISSTIVSSPMNRVTGASPKIKCSSMAGAAAVAVVATSSSTARSNSSNKWDPPLLCPLPPTFLRLTSNETRTEFDIPDEQFAIMLQNEEFMNELRWNQEFMLALEKEQQEKGKNEGDDLVFTERLKHMGKRSRKKFMQLAKVFTWQRNKKPGVRHPDSLLLQEEHSDDDEPKRIPKK